MQPRLLSDESERAASRAHFTIFGLSMVLIGCGSPPSAEDASSPSDGGSELDAIAPVDAAAAADGSPELDAIAAFDAARGDAGAAPDAASSTDAARIPEASSHDAAIDAAVPLRLADMPCHARGEDGWYPPQPFHPFRPLIGAVSVSRDERVLACTTNEPWRIYYADLDRDLVEFRDLPLQPASAADLTPSAEAIVVHVRDASLGDVPAPLLVYSLFSATPPLRIEDVLDYGIVEGPDAATVGARLIVLRAEGAEMVLETRVERGGASPFSTAREVLRGPYLYFPHMRSTDGAVVVARGDRGFGTGALDQRIDLLTGVAITLFDIESYILVPTAFDGTVAFAQYGSGLVRIPLLDPARRTDVPGVTMRDALRIFVVRDWFYIDGTDRGLVRWRIGDATSESVLPRGTDVLSFTPNDRIVIGETDAGTRMRTVSTVALDGTDRRFVATATYLGVGEASPDGDFVVADDGGVDGWLVRGDGALRVIRSSYRAFYAGGAAVMDDTLVYRDDGNCLRREPILGGVADVLACSTYNWSTVLPLRSRHVFLTIASGPTSGSVMTLVAPVP